MAPGRTRRARASSSRPRRRRRPGPVGPAAGRGFWPSLRRILIDLIEEYARHVGHADLIRESIDGLVGEDPPG
jgi:hypothetical protein